VREKGKCLNKTIIVVSLVLDRIFWLLFSAFNTQREIIHEIIRFMQQNTSMGMSEVEHLMSYGAFLVGKGLYVVF